VRLFPDELAREEPLRSETDVDLELPAICAFANEFLAPIPLSEEDAELCDEALSTLLRSTSPSLKVEVAERLAHVEQGPRRAVRLLAYDRTPAIAVPVLRYSPLLGEDEVAAIARLRSQRFSEDHLTAIAARRELDTRVTDLLIARGTWRVLETLADNETARFSLLGLCRLAMRSHPPVTGIAPAAVGPDTFDPPPRNGEISTKE
jgi:uncharacterized protein (DUF2336 family)